MDVLYERCAGLDIHHQVVVACLLTPGKGGRPQREVRSFGTMTHELTELGDWLAAAGATHVAMESTGVYWQPVWNLLEDRFTLLLVNPQHIKAVPGRKTDPSCLRAGVKDSEWLADLLRHGLLKASFVLDRAQRELRELTRYRTSLVEERAAEVNRVQKTLEGANIKLGAVVSDVMGVSARQMLAGLVQGEGTPEELAQLVRGRLRGKQAAVAQALAGRVGAHQRFLLAQQLAHVDYLDEAIAGVSAEIAERERPFEEAVERLDEIPGVGRRVAEIIVAEVGTDMSRFPSAGHLASWAGMCPGSEESAGKRKSGKRRPGNRALRQALTEAAQAAGKKKDSYLREQHRRLSVRRGKKKARAAVGHSILVIVYHLLKDPSRRYQDLGASYFEERDRQRVERGAVRRLERLGYRVTLEPAAA